jgi:hypothetical protein
MTLMLLGNRDPSTSDKLSDWQGQSDKIWFVCDNLNFTYHNNFENKS